MNKLNVAIFFGGESLEHNVSVITGKQVMQSLNNKKYNLYPIFIDTNGTWWHIKNYKHNTALEHQKKCKVLILMGKNYFYFNNIIQNKIKIHCAINCLHGGFGEIGALNEMLKQCNIPVTSSFVTSGVTTLNKYLTKLILKNNNLNVLPYILLPKKDYNQLELNDFTKKYNFPLVVKPVNMGSSIGVDMVYNFEELQQALSNVFMLNSDAILEQGISKVTEYNCACMLVRDHIVISEIEKPIKKHNILTYAEKYGSKNNKMGTKQGIKKGFSALGRQFPAIISEQLKHKIQTLTKQAYTLFNCAGIIRCDFIYYKRKLYLNEINSVPGSLAHYLFEPNGYTFSSLLDSTITTSILEFNKNRAH